jgi:hypothetical protein
MSARVRGIVAELLTWLPTSKWVSTLCVWHRGGREQIVEALVGKAACGMCAGSLRCLQPLTGQRSCPLPGQSYPCGEEVSQ